MREEMEARIVDLRAHNDWVTDNLVKEIEQIDQKIEKLDEDLKTKRTKMAQVREKVTKAQSSMKQKNAASLPTGKPTS